MTMWQWLVMGGTFLGGVGLGWFAHYVYETARRLQCW